MLVSRVITRLETLDNISLTSVQVGEALVWDGTNWVNGSAGVSDHGALSGLIDDDHSQYIINEPGTSRNLITPPDSTFPGLQIARSSTVSGGSVTTDNLFTIGPDGLTSNWLGVKANGRIAVNKTVSAAAGAQLDLTPDSTSTVGLRIDMVASYTANAFQVRDSSGNVRARIASDGQITALCNSNAGGVSIDGTTNPGLQVLVSGVAKGFVASAVTSASAYFTDSAVGDLVHRSEAAGARILFGNGGADPAAFGVGKTQSVFQSNDVAVIPLVIRAKASQTAALLAFEQKSSTSANRTVATVDGVWVDSTDASRKARLVLSAYDTAAREGLRIDASGSAAMVGFFGATAVIKQAGTGETAGFTAGGGTTVTDASTFTGNVGATAYRISDIVKALKNYGLLTS